MNQTSRFAASTHALHCALELSKKSWLLAIQFPDREQPTSRCAPHAHALAAKVAPDGYTLLMGGNSALVISPN